MTEHSEHAFVRRKVAVVGEILWDVFPDAERIGGASFNFAVHLHRLGQEVMFLSAVGDDERGHKALDRMHELGLSVEHVPVVSQRTGTVSVQVRDGEPAYEIHRPAAYDYIQCAPGVVADWIYYGTLHNIFPQPRRVLEELIVQNPGARRFYDVNLRRDCYTPGLLRELLSRATVIKMNETEEAEIQTTLAIRLPKSEAICITRGQRGCSLRVASGCVEVPGQQLTAVADAVGAGDAFAAALLHGIIQEWPAKRTAEFANRLGALVASRSGAIPDWNLEELA